MKRLFYVRHGETEMNVAELLSGTIETSLTENGIKQAIEAGKEIRERLPNIDLIICSPLERAYQTASLIAEQIDYPVSKIERNELFVERTFGVLEGSSATRYLEDDHRNYHELDAVEGAETVEDLQKRAAKAFEYVSQLESDTILIVAHGAFGRALRRVTKNQHHSREYEKFEQIPNATVLELI